MRDNNKHPQIECAQNRFSCIHLAFRRSEASMWMLWRAFAAVM
jgi:hypothetical protein